MVVYTCNDEDCGRVFQQEPAYINHMMKHLNEGGEYLKDLTPKRKRKAKTPKPVTAPIEKKKRETKRIESAREEWEKRQKRRRHEAEAATALAGASAEKKNRKRRRKVWQTIASGRVGDGNGQGETIDLRSPSRSPSIECITPQTGTRRNFTLTPDTTVPSTSRSSTPGEGIGDMAISTLHHLTASLASLASGSKRNNTSTTTGTLDSSSKGVSEEAVLAHHHQSAPTYPTPHASRENSEEAIIAHHQNSASQSPFPQIARGVSEEAIIKHHHNSPTPQATRGTSKEAIIMHHQTSPLPQGTSTMSEQAIVAYHHRSVSISPTPPISREMLEEAVIAHHHFSPTPARSQIIQKTPNASPVSDRSILEHHHASATRSSHSSEAEEKGMISIALTEPVKPTITEINEAKTFKSDSLSMQKSGISLLQPFAYPASTPLPSPPLTPMVKRASITDSFFKNPTQDEEDVSMDADIEYTTQGLTTHERFMPSTPPRDSLTGVSALHVPVAAITPITPSRLGPSWKTETAPQSVIDDEEVDELESESGDDAGGIETPRLLQYRLDTPLSFRQSLSPQEIEDQHEQDIDMENPYSNAWAFEYGIDPRQWDDVPAKSPRQNILDDRQMDDEQESDEGSDNAGEGSSGEDEEEDTEEEDDEDIVEGECGYRVFAGWADVVSTMSPEWDYRHQTATTPSSSIKSFGSLTPRRPTAFEATTGGRYERYLPSHRPNDASPGSSNGRVSAELGSPLTPESQAGSRSVTSGPSPPRLIDSRFHYGHESINAKMPDTHQGPAAGEIMPKRDQVVLALLQSGHIALARDPLRG